MNPLTMNDDLYFSYGSNMNAGQMAWRCPAAISLGRARLYGWRLAERVYADISQDDERATLVSMTEGVLWRITPDCLTALDRYEGYPAFYGRESVVVMHRGKALRCMTYAMTPACAAERDGARFPMGYAEGCAEGAAEHGIRPHHLYLAAMSRSKFS